MARLGVTVPADARSAARRDAGNTRPQPEEKTPVTRDDRTIGRRLRALVVSAGQLCFGSLLARLVLIVLAIDGIAALLVGGVIVYQARSAAQIEIAASMGVGELLVTDTIGVMKAAAPDLLLQTMDLQFRSVRHVRIAVTDAAGHAVHATGSLPPDADAGSAPPAWFAKLIALPHDRKVVPVLLHNRLIGNVTITSEPSDEIGEAWHYAHALLQAGFGLALVALAALLLLFGRALAPLTALAKGLRDLEDLTYTTRLRPTGPRELAVITDHFNRTAAVLQAANAANRTLSRELVTAQDDERRRTALELHDEVGPCLFALDASATSAATLAASLEGAARIHERTREVLHLLAQLKSLNRRMLEQMRPMGLGRIPLTECLTKIVVDLSIASTPAIVHEFADLADSYGPLVDLTVYRCVQEGTFNAIRHAHASWITIDVRGGPDRRTGYVVIRIEDDGRGLASPPRAGLGLAGMRERVSALGGDFALATSDQGTRLDIAIPLSPDGNADADATGVKP